MYNYKDSSISCLFCNEIFSTLNLYSHNCYNHCWYCFKKLHGIDKILHKCKICYKHCVYIDGNYRDALFRIAYYNIVSLLYVRCILCSKIILRGSEVQKHTKNCKNKI